MYTRNLTSVEIREDCLLFIEADPTFHPFVDRNASLEGYLLVSHNVRVFFWEGEGKK